MIKINLKKALMKLSVICTIIWVSPLIWAATYYIDATGGDDTNQGTSQNSPWKTLTKINGSTFQPGDKVLFRRGQSWYGELVVSSSGKAGDPVVFGAYGVGNKPIISAMGSVTAWQNPDRWTKYQNDVWQMNVDKNPIRLLLNGREYPRAKAAHAIESTLRWHWSNNQLYVYAPNNPATYYERMEHPATKAHAVFLQKKDYITIQNLDLRGGAYATLRLSGADYSIIEDSDMGLYAGKWGVKLEQADHGSDPDPDSNDNIIRRCTIDSGKRFVMNYYYVGPYEGIFLQSGANRNEIYENTIRDWLHAHVSMMTRDPKYTVNYNKIYNNYISASHVDYGRGFAVQSPWSGTVSYNEIYGNHIYDTGVRNQIGCDYNLFAYNIIDTVTDDRTPYRSDAIAQGLSLSVSNDPKTGWIQQFNKIYNNIIYNCEEPGLRITSHSFSIPIENNEIINNIILDCGKASRSNRNGIGITIENDSFIRGNIYKNNVIYNNSYTEVVYYRGDGPISVKVFNTKSFYGDQISVNLFQDPQFMDISQSNFRLRETSPCIDRGVDVSLKKDFAGVLVPQGGQVDIGSFEYVTESGDLIPPRPPTGFAVISK